MSSTQRKTIKELFKKLQKKNSSVATLPGENRDVLEHFVFALFLENTRLQSALETFAVLEHYFIDWNEVRVSTANELSALFPNLNNPARAGERLRRILQWIFEARYQFDLEDLRSKPIEAVRDFFTSIPYSTRFMNHYILRILFPSEAIPCDEGMFRILRLLNCVDIDSANKEVPVGFEVFKTRTDKSLLFSALHELGAEFMLDVNSASIKSLLKSLDPESEARAWVPLADSEDEDPIVIARRFSRREKKHRLPSLPLDTDIDILDENFDVAPIGEEEVDFLDEVTTETCIESESFISEPEIEPVKAVEVKKRPESSGKANKSGKKTVEQVAPVQDAVKARKRKKPEKPGKEISPPVETKKKKEPRRDEKKTVLKKEANGETARHKKSSLPTSKKEKEPPPAARVVEKRSPVKAIRNVKSEEKKVKGKNSKIEPQENKESRKQKKVVVNREKVTPNKKIGKKGVKLVVKDEQDGSHKGSSRNARIKVSSSKKKPEGDKESVMKKLQKRKPR